MTKIKLCGLTRACDIETVNQLKPDYIGFVFWPKSKRNLSKEQAKELKSLLDPEIQVIGVFVDENMDTVANLLEEGIIDIAQLHGSEDEEYIETLRNRTGKIIFKAFTIKDLDAVERANASNADCVLVDSGKGSGVAFDWNLLKEMKRPYLLAGGLSLSNVEEAITLIKPYGVDVSSGIESDGKKDVKKMIEFVNRVRCLASGKEE
ncbi:MAG: phosphoribosylanthranilate isomerase [Eubacteriales bacterium]|nr:phosphoribosylanthranilate isomerase [Eubacteriales bacterium]